VFLFVITEIEDSCKRGLSQCFCIYDNGTFEMLTANQELPVMEMAVTTEGGGSSSSGPMNVTMNKGPSSVTKKVELPLETACKVGVS